MQKQKIMISALVANHPGVLGHVVGLFSRRAFNIDSLTVCECEDPAYSRITITVRGEWAMLRQITRQFMKLEDVKKTVVLDPEEASASELLLVKVTAAGEQRAQVLKTAQTYGAGVLDVGEMSVTLEHTGRTEELDRFIERMRSQGILEMARTGAAALGRGDATIKESVM